jgi:hypothetical protein
MPPRASFQKHWESTVNDDSPMPISQVRREIAVLRELLEEKINSLDAVMTVRLDAMDKALVLAESGLSLSTLSDVKDQLENMVRRVTELENRK